MALGEPDASGRRRPEATGEYFTEAFDTVIAAVSQKPDLAFLENDEIELPVTRWLTQESDPDTMHSGLENIFSIGDFRRGPATAIEAVADGRIAAQSIDRFFNGDMENIPVKPFNSQKAPKVKQVDPQQFAGITKVMRSVMPELSTEERELSFAEVETGFMNEEAIREAERCLECGCQANTDCSFVIMPPSIRWRTKILIWAAARNSVLMIAPNLSSLMLTVVLAVVSVLMPVTNRRYMVR